MTTHEDNRRILEAYPEGKLIIAKTDCTVGQHYHNVKTEKFVALEGDIWIHRTGYATSLMLIGNIYEVLPNVKHSFNMKEGSVMIGLCSHPYDHNDDYK